MLGDGTASSTQYTLKGDTTNTDLRAPGSGGAIKFVVGAALVTSMVSSDVFTSLNNISLPPTPILTANATNGSFSRIQKYRFDWTNSMLTGFGSSPGNIAVVSLPPKCVLRNAYIAITGQASSTGSLTVSLGRTSTSYDDYIIANSAKASAGTLYGATSGTRGTNLTGYDVPNFSGGSTLVYLQFLSSVSFAGITGSAGSVYIEAELLQ